MSIFQRFQSKQANQYLITSGRTLLKPHKKVIGEIRSIVGLDKRFWKQLYLDTLINLAEYVQELPASESHHHSGRGGLLTHTLETCLDSMRIRRGKILPPNSDAETVTKMKDLWTYAIFTGAIGHDLGKPITDIKVELKSKKNNETIAWSPFKGSMSMNKEFLEYVIRYRRKRVYASHGRASALYLHHIIPSFGLEWLASNQDVFFYWNNLLTGHEEESGIIGSIIHEADKRSVAANLAGDQVSNDLVAATTNRKPLHQRIITSLRYQIDEGLLPLNRDGAAGWIVDGKLWVVVKRALDQVRAHMEQEGQSGIPARNDRLMDELQQYNILLACHDKAVWKAQVFAPEWNKAHELTLLCIPVENIWLSEDAVPESFSGTVKSLGSSNSEVQTVGENKTATLVSNENKSVENIPQEQPENPAIRPPSIDFSTLVAASDQKSTDDTKTSGSDEHSPASASHSKPTEALLFKAKAPSLDSKEVKNTQGTPGKTKQAGEDFLKWLRDGLHRRTFKVNDVNSKIHMTKEGMFLVSPAIFKLYDRDRWEFVQKGFTRLKLNEKNTLKNGNIHKYLAKGAKRTSEIKGYLIADTANVFPGIELPNINHALSLPVHQ